MDPKLQTAINDQISLEFETAHAYRAMGYWFELNDLPGFAAWMSRQSAEEVSHGERLVSHLLEREIAPRMSAIAEPRTDFESAKEAMEEVLSDEQRVTQSILGVCEIADRTGDRAAQILLQWFVSEQLEEEAAAKAILGRLRLAGDGGAGLLMVDQEVGRMGLEESAEAD